MIRSEVERQISQTHAAFEVDISEFWRLAKIMMYGLKKDRERADEFEAEFPDAAGSIANYPEKLSGLPYSLDSIIKVLLVFEIVLFEEVLNRYKRLIKSIPLLVMKEAREISLVNVAGIVAPCARLLTEDDLASIDITSSGSVGSQTVLAQHLKDLVRGYIIRNLLVHNDGVMNKQTFKKYPICVSICPVDKKVPLSFELIYRVHRGLVSLNTCLQRVCLKASEQLPATCT